MSAQAAHPSNPLYHGMVAEFTDPDAVLKAAKRVHSAGYKSLDAYTPFPVHGLDDAIGFKCAKVQWTIFWAAIVGFIVGMGLQVWVSTMAYPLNVGGRPKISWPQFIPVAYECTILFAGISAFVGVLAWNGLPQPYHPIFNTPNFEQASQASFFLAIEATDPAFEHGQVKDILEGCDGVVAVNDVFGDEPEAGR